MEAEGEVEEKVVAGDLEDKMEMTTLAPKMMAIKMKNHEKIIFLLTAPQQIKNSSLVLSHKESTS